MFRTKGKLMRTRTFARNAAIGAALLFAASAAPAQDQAAAATPALAPSPLASASPSITPFRSQATNIDDYKKHAAGHIITISKHELAESLPPILKSVVVLDITVDREGNIVRVAKWRSNGYEDLEQIAINSVKRAGKLPAPSAEVLKGQESVRFLETWLFAHNGRYHVRSVIPADFPIDEIKDVARSSGKKPAKGS
jgi:protein TonB